jgi:hypothetical protein
MAKKTYTAFPAVNCQRIRNLQEIITKSEKQRDDAFAARDHALEQIHACGEAETEKRTRLKADHSDAVCKLDGLAKTIKWARKELATTIEQADEENLFDSAELDVPDWDAEDKADDADDRPVGEHAQAAQADTIEAYIPGRFKDQNGNEANYHDMDAIRERAAGLGNDIDIVPMISPSFGCTIEFRSGKTSRGTLTYVSKPKGRRAG